MTPEQGRSAEETLHIWKQEAQAGNQEIEAENTFWDDVQAYREERLEDIEPGLREDMVYMAQLAAAAQGR